MNKTFAYLSLLPSLIIGFLIGFNNCSPQWSSNSSEFVEISQDCGQSKVVNKLELQEISHLSHHPPKNQRVKCPGFFANIDDHDSSENLAFYKTSLQQKTLSENNNCNIEGPTSDPEVEPPPPSTEATIEEFISKTNANNIESWVRTLSDGTLGNTRRHDSSVNNQAPQWIKETFESFSQGRSDIRVQFFNHQNTTQNSVEVIITGSETPDEYVIIGGHHDSIVSGGAADFRAPGADDNASGVATVLEAFRTLVENGYKPKKSLAFYTYAAEEVGLVGSQEIARSYSNAGKTVRGVMQIDMAMYAPSETTNIYFVRDYTSNSLTEHTANLAKKYLNLNPLDMNCGYACSDHASWNRYNYPAIMPAEYYFRESVNRIHTTADILDDKMSAEHAENFAKLAIAFLISLSQ